MKTIDPLVTAHLSQTVTTLSICWKITLKSGAILTFTDHDRDLIYDGLTYKATTGFSSSGSPSNLDMKVNSIDVQSFIDDVYIKEEDILAGAYDDAKVEVFKVNWGSPDDGRIVSQIGFIGDIEVVGPIFIAEVRGRMQVLKKTVGQLYSPNCRAVLGDVKCTVNMSTYLTAGSVSGITSNRIFTVGALGQADSYFRRGLIEWTSGKNVGLQTEVKDNIADEISLILNALFPVEVGDTFNIYPGCNKSSVICKTVYNNLLNFRGEPFIPSMTTTVSPRST